MNTRNKSFSLKWLIYTAILISTFLFIASLMTAAPARHSRSTQAQTVARAELLGTVQPLHTVAVRDLPLAVPGDLTQSRDLARRTYPRGNPVTPAQDAFGIDPLMGTFSVQRSHSNRDFETPLLNFDAQNYSGVNPSDNVGDVGLNHYVQAINGATGTPVTIYDKTNGAVVAGPFNMDTLAPSGICTSGLGDPIIIYDQYADRWLWSEFSNAANGLCVYISDTSDPLGTFTLYTFPTAQFPDYPKYGVWDDGYYVTTNESAPAIYAMERDEMLAGNPAQIIRVTAPSMAGFPFQALTPSDADGETLPPNFPPVLMRHRDDEVHNAGSNEPTEDYIDVFEFVVDWATPGNSVLNDLGSVAVAEFDSELCGLVSFSCFGQPPAGGTPLDPLREVIMWRLQYRNFGAYESWVGSFVTDVDGTNRGGTRWFELRAIGGAITLHQEGLISASDDIHRWMSTIAQDGSGNIAVGYNIVDEDDTYPGARYTGREYTDAPGLMTQGELLMIDGSAANTSFRWGDYNSINVDPVDDCTFWFTANYSPLAQWRTRVAVFRFDSCTGVPLTPTPTATEGPTPTSTPAVITEELLENIGFENLGTDGKPDITPWELKNPTGDKGKCNKDKDGDGIPDKIFANSGDCAFRFKGIVGENSKLTQTFVPEITDVFVSGDTLDISLFYNGATDGLDAVVKLRVKYSDTTEKGKVNITLSTSAVYTQVTAPYTIQSDAVSKIKVQISHKTASGKLLIDDTSLVWSLSGGARGMLIPIPQENQLRSSK